MKSKYYIFSLVVLLVGLFPFYVNLVAASNFIYGGQIFHHDISKAVSLEYLSYLKFLIILSASTLITFLIINKVSGINCFSMIRDKFYFKIDFSKRNILINSIIIFFISLLFKILLFNFDLDFNDASYLLNDYYYGDKFDVYKLYTFIAVLTSKITTNYSLYLSILNIIFGSLTISIFYLLLSTFNKSFFLNNLIVLFILFYLPFSAVDTMIRTDSLYLFLFIFSIFLTVKLTEENNFKYFIALSFILFLSCIAREQTIYILPLYLIFILFSKINNKKIIVSFISLMVIITSTLLSNYNKNKYGISSLFKDRILIIAAMQYGYLNPSIKAHYENSLSDNAKVLLNDINNSYIKNVLPSKREVFKDKYGLPGIWNLIRPDYQKKSCWENTLQ